MSWLSRFFGGRERVVPERVRDVGAFERLVIASERPVIVDVWSATCGPCKKLEPVLVDVATRHAERVRVVEIATQDSEPELLARLDVRATPTLVIFDRGEELGRVTGYRPAEWFDQMIAAELSGE